MKDARKLYKQDSLIDTIKGTVESVVFYNAENGYTVLSLKTATKTESVVGNLPVVSVGETLVLTGTRIRHQRYGEQFAVESFSVENPEDRENVIKYLSSGLVRGVGVKTAENIYNLFGSKTMETIENSPLMLTSVKGVSQMKAVAISESVLNLKKMQSAVMYLLKYSVTPHTAVKIYNVYKENTQSVIESNPYKLIDDVDGIGFLSADRIALSTGCDKLGEFRIRAGLIYCLKETAEKNGNTYLLEKDLLLSCEELLDITFSEIEETLYSVLTKMELEPVIKRFVRHDEKCVALLMNYLVERGIASKLIKLNAEAKRIQLNASKNIAFFESVNALTLDEGQKAAVISALFSGVSVITGGPGTGKTTIIKCIASIFKQNGLRVAFCAPTGRAAKRIEQSCGFEAKTIHRLLGVEVQNGKLGFSYNQQNPLPFDVVVVDEMSMVDINIFNSLLKAIDSGARLLLVGDKDQLPSVGAGNVLSDIIKSKLFEVNFLQHIYRQSEDSLIVSNAHLINCGKYPEINNSSKDFFFITTDGANAAPLICDLVATRLPKYTQVDSMEIQTMAALKSGDAGVEKLNAALQKRLNPPSPNKNELLFGKTILREGDRVMQTVNNYLMEWRKFNPNGTCVEKTGVFNGDIGFISKIDKLSTTAEVIFDDNRVAEYKIIDLFDLQLAYAVTVHKSQGNEFPVAVISLVNGPPTIINRNLLYTAITRAKKAVVLVGSKKVLALMVHNNYIATRLTMLKDFLLSEKSKYEKFFG